MRFVHYFGNNFDVTTPRTLAQSNVTYNGAGDIFYKF